MKRDPTAFPRLLHDDSIRGLHDYCVLQPWQKQGFSHVHVLCTELQLVVVFMETRFTQAKGRTFIWIAFGQCTAKFRNSVEPLNAKVIKLYMNDIVFCSYVI